VLLHQSPLSSRDMLPTMQRWGARFTCIAPDTPGYGNSDPFGVAHAEMADIAQAVVEFFDAVGIDKAAVYGFHTGAMISVALARYFPDRIVCAVANGYVLLTEQERADIVANYLPPLVPAWDGSHLAWLWSRMREQTIFFPWYRKALEDRLNFDVPQPTALQAAALDLLRAGDHYRVGYRAAFTMASDAALRDVQVPTLITAAETDVLAKHLERVHGKSRQVTIERGASAEATLDLAARYLARYKLTTAPKLRATAPIPGRLWQEMIEVPGGQLRAKRNDDAKGTPVVVQHDAAGSSDIVRRLAEGFVGKRPVLAVDLPGHGESDNTLPRGKVTVGAYAKSLATALDALEIERCDFLGQWGGGLLGLELATSAPKRIDHLILADLLYFDAKLTATLKAHYTPDIQPDWYGGHLLHAWMLMRDQGLFWPWFERTRRGIIWQPVRVDPEMVHRRVIEVFKAPVMWRAAYQAHFAYPTRAKLARVTRPVLLAAPRWDPNLEHTRRAAQDFPRLPFRSLPDDPLDWGREVLEFLSA
jgi:pimeloyl-ACP methyl ester carboxylesterase